MKHYNHLWLITFALFLLSCGNEQQPGVNPPLASAVAPKPFVIPKNSSLCFEQVSGDRNQDTLRVQLNFHGDRVTGSMANIPDGKDARTGELSGLLLQQDVKAKWIYVQEGVQDSMEVEFRLGNEELLQRPFIVNAANGRMQTDTSAGYTMRIPLAICK